MADTNPAAELQAKTQRLMEYWARGPGAVKIRWGTDGEHKGDT